MKYIVALTWAAGLAAAQMPVMSVAPAPAVGAVTHTVRNQTKAVMSTS